ncbi:MAG: hypothetical protein R3F59_35840 [Myxococcota bacterium]
MRRASLRACPTCRPSSPIASPDSRPLVARLFADPLRPLPELVSEVQSYAGFVRAFARVHPGIDADRAERLAARCVALTERVSGEAQHRLVQTACLYLVAIEGDLDEGEGFEDDEAVVEAVEAAL